MCEERSRGKDAEMVSSGATQAEYGVPLNGQGRSGRYRICPLMSQLMQRPVVIRYISYVTLPVVFHVSYPIKSPGFSCTRARRCLRVRACVRVYMLYFR